MLCVPHKDGTQSKGRTTAFRPAVGIIACLVHILRDLMYADYSTNGLLQFCVEYYLQEYYGFTSHTWKYYTGTIIVPLVLFYCMSTRDSCRASQKEMYVFYKLQRNSKKEICVPKTKARLKSGRRQLITISPDQLTIWLNS